MSGGAPERKGWSGVHKEIKENQFRRKSTQSRQRRTDGD